jgi:hypothetical protein
MVVISIVAAALVQREFGAVCLPAPNIGAAAIGMAFDLLLDIYLIFRAIKLFSNSEEDNQPIEFVVLVSSIALLAWHFVRLLIFALLLILEFYSSII